VTFLLGGLEVRDVALFLQNAGNLQLQPGGWNIHLLVPRLSALRTLVSISATGSVNLIVCFSSSHPFAPRFAENLRQLALPLPPSHRERDARVAQALSRH
jgi:hypothetical protein